MKYQLNKIKDALEHKIKDEIFNDLDLSKQKQIRSTSQHKRGREVKRL